MSLFELSNTTQEIASKALPVASEGSSIQLHSNKVLQEVIGKLEKGQQLHFMSKGEWSMHELLGHILQQTGPASIYISTWTITDEPVAKLFLMKEQGLITALHCILDYRIKDRKPEPFQFLEQTADRILLTKCHAKVTIVENEEWQVVIVSSANYSRNPRIEVGIICTDNALVHFHKDWMETQFADGLN